MAIKPGGNGDQLYRWIELGVVTDRAASYLGGRHGTRGDLGRSDRAIDDGLTHDGIQVRGERLIGAQNLSFDRHLDVGLIGLPVDGRVDRQLHGKEAVRDLHVGHGNGRGPGNRGSGAVDEAELHVFVGVHGNAVLLKRPLKGDLRGDRQKGSSGEADKREERQDFFHRSLL